MRKNVSLFVLLIVLLLLFRVGSAAFGEFLPNIVPFAALFFCAAAFFRVCPLLLPAALVTWVLGGPVASLLQGYPIWHSGAVVGLGAMFLAAGIGFLFRDKKSLSVLIGGTLVAAIAFYALTNTVSFLSDPRYVKTWEGYAQAMWTGVPGSPYPPTWVFFRNSLCANTLFTILFVVTLRFPAFGFAKRFELEPLSSSH